MVCIKRIVPCLTGLLLLGVMGCRRTPPVDLSLTAGLSALTNMTAVVQSPRGVDGFTTFEGHAVTLSDGQTWVDIANLEGPGRLERLWTNADGSLNWRFYFDHEPVPRLDLTTAALFGGQSPFKPPLAETVGGGRVSYVPVAYRQNLRIAVGGSTDPSLLSNLVVQINDRRFDGDRVVGDSFSGNLAPAEEQVVKQVRAAWRDTEAALHEAADACGSLEAYDINPGATVRWLESETPGIVRAFRLRLAFPPHTGMIDRARMLRALVLRITWDHADHPSVEVPLGDFFVNADRSRRFSSLPLGVIADYDFVSRFPMPFRRSVHAELRNDGPLPVTVHAAHWVDPGRPPRDLRSYFHATWRQQVGEEAEFIAARVAGRGHLVGMTLNAFAMSSAWRLFEGVDTLQADAGMLRRGTSLAAAFNGYATFSGLYDAPLAGLVETAPIRLQAYRWMLTERPRFDGELTAGWFFADEPPEPRGLASTVYWYQPSPRPVADVPPLAQRESPDDPLAGAAIMGALIELERIGHDDEARDRSIEYYERNPGTLISDFLRIRALAYEQRISGFPAVADLYRDIAQRVAGTMVGRELERWLWFHQAPDHGLFATQINGRFRAYLNGVRVEQGDNPTTMVVRPVRIRPGTNEVAVKVIPNKPDAWLSVVVLTHGGKIVSGPGWEFARERPSDWPATTCPLVTWSPVGWMGQFPLPRWWRLTPNMFPYFQSGPQLVRPWQGAGWTEPPYRETFFRHRFVAPAGLPETDHALPDASPSSPYVPD